LPALFAPRDAGKTFTNMVKTPAASGEMHNCFAGSVARQRRI
jgi:hypothetical protein